MALIAKRYAEALLDIALRENALESYRQQLQTLAGIFAGQEDLRIFLHNPRVHKGIKKETITEIFGNKLDQQLLNFLILLLDKGRLGNIGQISSEFDRLANRKQNILDLTIISAAPVDEQQVEKIKEKYVRLYDASSAKVRQEIDKSVIGGVKVKIGDKVIDGTVKGRLESLRESMTNKL